MHVSDIMTRDVVTLTPGNSVRHAAQIMLNHQVSGAPVLDGECRLIGILTEGDLLRRVEFGVGMPTSDAWARANWTEGGARDFVRSHSQRVGDVMSTSVVTVSEETSLNDVAILLGTRGIKRVPVLHDGALVGIVSRSDLLKIIAATTVEPIASGDEAMRTSVVTHLLDAASMFATCPEVTVSGGIVHLWGKVRSEAERDAARVAIEAVPGVNGIEDHLTVGVQ